MGILIIGVVVYNMFLYSKTASHEQVKLSEKALAGAKLYQDNNCTACHQFYGLGGYLGPDLTNVASRGENSRQRIKTFLNLGYKSMPKFDFTEEELDDIVQFLIEVDQTGYYPDCVDEIKPSGWVKVKTKQVDEAK